MQQQTEILECSVGDSAEDFWEKSGIVGTRRILLDNIRENKNSVQEITSGPVQPKISNLSKKHALRL